MGLFLLSLHQMRDVGRLLGEKFSLVLRSGFLRDVAKLSIGTITGRVIAVAVMPLLTRVYTPDDFALLAVYLGILNIIAVVACLRLDIAIPLAPSDTDAVYLLTLSLLMAAAIASVVGVITLAAPRAVADFLGKPAIAPHLWLLPLGIWMAGTYSAFQFWATRFQRFTTIARTRVTQAIAGTLTALGLGWVGVTPLGLLLGSMLSVSAGGTSLAFQTLTHDRKYLKEVSLRRLPQTLRTYRRYPVYSTIEAVANATGLQLPMILVSAYAGSEAGHLMIAMQVLNAPMLLLGSSIAQAYTSRLHSELNANRLAPFTLEILKRLAQVGVGPLLFIGIVGPTFFPIVFGREWVRAGQIAAMLVPWLALQFLASPVSMILHASGKQQWAMILQITGLALRTGAVWLTAVFANQLITPAFAAASALFYALYLAVILRTGAISSRTFVNIIPHVLIFALPWVLLAVVADRILMLFSLP